jgi:hypothetical protein
LIDRARPPVATARDATRSDGDVARAVRAATKHFACSAHGARGAVQKARRGVWFLTRRLAELVISI